MPSRIPTRKLARARTCSDPRLRDAHAGTRMCTPRWPPSRLAGAAMADRHRSCRSERARSRACGKASPRGMQTVATQMQPMAMRLGSDDRRHYPHPYCYPYPYRHYWYYALVIPSFVPSPLLPLLPRAITQRHAREVCGGDDRHVRADRVMQEHVARHVLNAQKERGMPAAFA